MMPGMESITILFGKSEEESGELLELEGRTWIERGRSSLSSESIIRVETYHSLLWTHDALLSTFPTCFIHIHTCMKPLQTTSRL